MNLCCKTYSNNNILQKKFIEVERILCKTPLYIIIDNMKLIQMSLANYKTHS